MCARKGLRSQCTEAVCDDAFVERVQLGGAHIARLGEDAFLKVRLCQRHSVLVSRLGSDGNREKITESIRRPRHKNGPPLGGGEISVWKRDQDDLTRDAASFQISSSGLSHTPAMLNVCAAARLS